MNLNQVRIQVKDFKQTILRHNCPQIKIWEYYAFVEDFPKVSLGIQYITPHAEIQP